MTSTIGGAVCREPLAARLLPAEPRELGSAEIDGLWRIFAAIGDTWRNTVYESVSLRSSWLEFVSQRSTTRPSYVAEYVNALTVLAELEDVHGDDAFHRLFFESRETGGNGQGARLAPTTRLAHAKVFVVDEFIRVQILAGGFRDFVRPLGGLKVRPDDMANYNGYVSTSRFNRIRPVRTFERSGE